MIARQDRQRIGSDLVRTIAVGRDPVRTNDDGIDLPGPQHRTGGIVGDEHHLDPGMLKLPCGEPRALKKRTGLIHKYPCDLALTCRSGDHAYRGTDPCCGERTRVAVREKGHRTVEQCCPVLADPVACGDVLVLDRQCFGQQGRCERLAARMAHDDRAHAGECIKEIHGGWAGRREFVDGFERRSADIPDPAFRRSLGGGGDTEAGSDTDRGRAADTQRTDGFSDDRDICRIDKTLLVREERLIQKPYVAVNPVDRPHSAGQSSSNRESSRNSRNRSWMRR